MSHVRSHFISNRHYNTLDVILLTTLFRKWMQMEDDSEYEDFSIEPWMYAPAFSYCTVSKIFLNMIRTSSLLHILRITSSLKIQICEHIIVLLCLKHMLILTKHYFNVLYCYSTLQYKRVISNTEWVLKPVLNGKNF